MKFRYASGTNLEETSVLITNVQTNTTSVFTEQSILNSTEGKNVTKYQDRNNLTSAGALKESLSFRTAVGATNLCGCDKQLAFGQEILNITLITVLH